MNDSLNMKDAKSEDIREIPKWARRYAESKTMPLVVMSFLYLVLCGVILGAVFCFTHKMILYGAIMMGVCVVAFIGSFFIERFCSTLCYPGEGLSKSENVERIKKFLFITLLPLSLMFIILEACGVFPAHLRVPVSALFVCPLLIFVNFRWARRTSFIGYLWAALYGAWAIAILFRVPILTFPDRWAGWEMFPAPPVTILITGLIAHIYNRYALRKLKKLATLKQDHSNK